MELQANNRVCIIDLKLTFMFTSTPRNKTTPNFLHTALTHLHPWNTACNPGTASVRLVARSRHTGRTSAAGTVGLDTYQIPEAPALHSRDTPVVHWRLDSRIRQDATRDVRGGESHAVVVLHPTGSSRSTTW